MITGKNYIGFQLSAKGSNTYRTFNPKQNTENDHLFTEATTSEIEKAANLAAEAFPVYSRMSSKKRSAFLNAIADEIEALSDLLIETYTLESGLPEGRAKGERGRTVGQLRMFAKLIENDNWRQPTIDLAIPDRTPAPKPDLRKLLIPIGPIVVFGASNFPLAFSTAGGDTASALAAGCPVIVKSHPLHAGTGELVASAMVKAAKDTGMPEGVFSNLNSSGIEVGEQLVSHPKIKGVGFTGSHKGGRALYNIASNRDEPIPVFAEMGSINPVVITNKALENRASEIASTYAGSITLGAGQFCTNPGLIVMLDSENTSKFIKDLGEKSAAIEAQCMLHPRIHASFKEKSQAVINQSKTTLVAEYNNEKDDNFAGAKIVTTTGEVFLNNPKLHQEVFGPFSLIVTCKDEKQLLKVIQNFEGQLTATIMAEEEDYANLSEICDALQHRVGRIVFNGVPTGVEVCDAMTHGGPYPASTDSRFTAVGNHAIYRWVRPFSFQDFPSELLPKILKP